MLHMLKIKNDVTVNLRPENMFVQSTTHNTLFHNLRNREYFHTHKSFEKSCIYQPVGHHQYKWEGWQITLQTSAKIIKKISCVYWCQWTGFWCYLSSWLIYPVEKFALAPMKSECHLLMPFFSPLITHSKHRKAHKSIILLTALIQINQKIASSWPAPNTTSSVTIWGRYTAQV